MYVCVMFCYCYFAVYNKYAYNPEIWDLSKFTFNFVSKNIIIYQKKYLRNLFVSFLSMYVCHTFTMTFAMKLYI